MTAWLRVCFAIATLVACGHHSNNNPAGGGGGDAGDAGVDAAPFSGICTPGGAQCANCVDDDGDGLADGFDPQCTGATDNDEATFATGIPGDNKDPVMQDCFFDGNSGAGNDGCDVHVCCLLGVTDAKDCPVGGNRYNPDECPPPLGKAPLPPKCIATCDKLTPPGCDCFGCCTICDPKSDPQQCYSIVINPVEPTGCTPDTLGDPSKCLRCTPNTQCGTPCGGGSCVLCPGQDPSDLPPSCNQTMACPDGDAVCPDGNCATGTYCSNGCCIGAIF